MENWKRQICSTVDQPEIAAYFVMAVTHGGQRCLSAKKLGSDLATAIAMEMIEGPDALKTVERMINVLKKANETLAQFLLAKGGRERFSKGGD
jgi:hypothetical protein